MMALLAIAITLLWRFLPRERLLLERASRITSAGSPFDLLSAFQFTGNQQPKAEIVYNPYLWRSERQVIIFHPTETMQPNIKVTYEANSMQIDSDIQEPMLALNKALTADLDASAHPPDYQQAWLWRSLCTNTDISPDGRWLLYGFSRMPSVSDNSPDDGYVALALDGSRRIVWPEKLDITHLIFTCPPPLWLPDNRHWIEIFHDGNNRWVNIYDLDNPHTTQKVKIIGTYVPYLQSIQSQLLGITHNGDVLIGVKDLFATSPSHSGFLISFPLPTGLRSDHTVLQARTISMPRNGGLPPTTQYPALLPYGDRLAWLIIQEIHPPGPVWMQRILTFLGQRKHTVIGLWVSRLDGSHMQEIGHMPYQPDEEIPQQIRWVPGDKRLSFIYKGSLYTVPADE